MKTITLCKFLMESDQLKIFTDEFIKISENLDLWS